MEQAPIQSTEEQTEALQAVGARVRRALNLLEVGDTEKAKTVLRALAKTLPGHERRHWLAAGDR